MNLCDLSEKKKQSKLTFYFNELSFLVETKTLKTNILTFYFNEFPFLVETKTLKTNIKRIFIHISS